MENQGFDEALEESRLMLVDTNVLLDVIQDDATWADWSISQLQSQSKVHQLVINPVIYAEISLAIERIEALYAAVAFATFVFSVAVNTHLLAIG